MKVYIHTDLEGVSGVDTIEAMDKGKPAYRAACERMMADINAAVDGAIAGGATHVTVLDSHGGGGNFIAELLDRRAEADPKQNGKWWGCLDRSYAGTFFIGAHAMAGTLNGFLDHTQSSATWFEYTLNGRAMGELAQWAIVAGSFGVPMLMVSGDQAACDEAARFFDPVHTAVVKRGIGRNRAELVPGQEALDRIREAARQSMALVGRAKPLRPRSPMEIKLRMNRSDYCDDLARRPGWERLDARTCRKVTSDPLSILP
jgi:D-amino peptidase